MVSLLHWPAAKGFPIGWGVNMLELRWFQILLGVTTLGFTAAGWYLIDRHGGATPHSAVAMVPPQTSAVAPAALAQTPAVAPAVLAQTPAVTPTTPAQPPTTAIGVAVVSPRPVEPRVLPETAPGGVVVLRGNHPANPDASQPDHPGGRSTGGNAPAAPLSLQISLPTGWDRAHTTGINWRDLDAAVINRNFDASGFHRSFDASGLNRNFDLSGLSPPIR
jgi:hypothetical protein